MKRFVSFLAVFIFLLGYVLPLGLHAQEIDDIEPTPELISEVADEGVVSESSDAVDAGEAPIPERISEESGEDASVRSDVPDDDAIDELESNVIDLDRELEPVVIDEESIDISFRQEDWNVFLFYASGDVPDPNRVDYLWDFGDDIKSASTPIRHEYRRSGTYTVSLQISDLDGNITTYTKELKISLFYLENPYLWVSLGLLLVVALAAMLIAIRFDSSGGGLVERIEPGVDIGGREKPALNMTSDSSDALDELDTIPTGDDIPGDDSTDTDDSMVEVAPAELDMSRDSVSNETGMLSYQGDEFAELDMLEKEESMKTEEDMSDDEPMDDDAGEEEVKPEKKAVKEKPMKKKVASKNVSKKKAATKKKVVKKKSSVKAKKTTAKKKPAAKKKKSTAKKTSRKKK